MGHAVAVFGASGYTGGELVRLLDGHPSLDPVFVAAHTRAGAPLADVHPHLSGGERILAPLDVGLMPPVELAFLALPHGASWQLGAQLSEHKVKVVDLGSDYRLDTPERYLAAYGQPHPDPAALPRWVYGLPELWGPEISAAARVAVPGCYPTSAVLALAPLINEGLVAEDGIVVDSLSGTSGAGRGSGEGRGFGDIADGMRAYGVGAHRHRPEMEMALEAASGVTTSVTFTPHLVPVMRGIVTTCYARLRDGAGSAELAAALEDAYSDAPFVEVGEEAPQSRWVVGSNRCLVAPFVDAHTGMAVVVSALDNLLKGAAGQALQCANLMLGLDETAGLPQSGWMP